MPINSNDIARPARLLAKTYTPPDGHKHKVDDRETWGTLAATVGMSAWELIRYNYPTLPADQQLATKEVNWYLQQYVGCTQLTPNQRNFVFSRTANPGEISLPNKPQNDAARSLVLNTLRGPAIARMRFGIGRIVISPDQYESVARAIESGYITVVVDPSLKNKAEYYWNLNEIHLATTSDPALIVHECTHAIFDLRKITTRVEETEGVAYVAQALYGLILYGPSPRYIVSSDPGHPISWAAWQVIFDESTRLATMILKTPWVSDKDADSLYWAIGHTNWYKPRVGNVERNDGVADDFYKLL
ncbi:MAG TPA: hypothetical protein VH325_14675 [Bryobacteraceae bacterium]|jgi:hypothetical protein|nr:hypothetical protein [Bryobacteraceae bacterium]